MAGGEFRLGTDSIYMADDGHIRPKSTSPKSWITWLRFGRKRRPSRVSSATYGLRKKEARANTAAKSQTKMSVNQDRLPSEAIKAGSNRRKATHVPKLNTMGDSA